MASGRVPKINEIFFMPRYFCDACSCGTVDRLSDRTRECPSQQGGAARRNGKSDGNGRVQLFATGCGKGYDDQLGGVIIPRLEIEDLSRQSLGLMAAASWLSTGTVLSDEELPVRYDLQFVAILLLLPLNAQCADDLSGPARTETTIPEEPLAEKGELLFADDFNRSDLGEWRVVIPTFTVEDGVLVGRQGRDDHGAVGRVYRAMKDVVVDFKFRLEGSKAFNVVFDDQKYKGSHAGHICRVSFNPKGIRLGDDREGIMRNDIFAMRRNPAQKAEAARLLEGRSSLVRATLKQKKWYQVTIEIVGDRMRVCLDGQNIGCLRSPGVAHDTKSSLHFTVNGPGVHFDDVHIWKAL